MRNQAGISERDTILVSAVEGTGSDELLAKISEKLARRRHTLLVEVGIGDGAAVAWLHRRGSVLERTDFDLTSRLKVSLDPEDIGRLSRQRGITVLEDQHEFSIAAE